MRIRSVIAAEKQVIDAGAWKAGKMPSTAFPLTKGALTVNQHYRWRCVHFLAEGVAHRLLIFYRLDLEKCTMYLGRHDDKVMTVLVRFEWHGTHEGWHCHVPGDCQDDKLAPGRVGGLQKRLPECGRPHRRCAFGIVGDESAYHLALTTFRIAAPSKSFTLVMQ